MARGRRWTEKDSAKLRRLVQAGLVDTDIAAALDRPRETVTRMRKKLGLRAGASPALLAALLRLAARSGARGRGNREWGGRRWRH